MTKLWQVVPYGDAGLPRKPYTVTEQQAELMVARGHARRADDGTRRLFECRMRARGESRFWRKVTNRGKYGGALYSTMQLVPGVSQGRNTGARNGNGTHGKVG